MDSLLLLLSAVGYFAMLLSVSRLTGKNSDNNAFFRANRNSPWWAVTYGMIGASVSGVTFVSVPGMVSNMQMTYLQACMGFVLGYAFVAFFLLPVYYKLNLTTIYTYLQKRYGSRAYYTGSVLFFISKLVGASIRLYLVCLILQHLIFSRYSIPFPLTTAMVLLLIWVYTHRSGINTIVWSDCIQTTVMLASLVLVIWQFSSRMGLSIPDMIRVVRESEMSRVFVFDDLADTQYFWKQFLSGVFIVVVMTGLDQDMMQKNLTCRTLPQSQLNMCVNGLLYLPVNLLFLSLGVLLYKYCDFAGIAFSGKGDELLPMLCSSGSLGNGVLILFTLGIVAAAFSSADSAMTSLTTCFCVDILRRPSNERLRRMVHPLIGVGFLVVILLVGALNSSSVINTVYLVCGYTYGPLLGLFAFGMLTHRMPSVRLTPYFCLLSPLMCYALDQIVQSYFGYKMGYELLMLNGTLTFFMLWVSSMRRPSMA